MAEQQQGSVVVMRETGGNRRRRLRPVRIVTLAIVFPLLGAIVNVVVAWGCTRWSEFTGSVGIDKAELFSIFTKREMLNPATQIDGHGADGIGIHMIEGAVRGSDRDRSVVAWILLFEAGWPFLSHRAEWRGKADDRQDLLASISLHQGLETSHRGRGGQFHLGNLVLPTAPIWPGFFLNTILYAFLLWLPFGLFIYAKRRRRCRCGQCPKCGYPMGESPRCTECGAVLPKRAMTSTTTKPASS